MARHVICMKWGTKYGPHYVNNLYAMARRHLQGDFRFICLTDNTDGIRAEVECFPIPRLDIRPEAAGVRDMAWRKLTTFSTDLATVYGLKGPALFLDLDVVVVTEAGDLLSPSRRAGDQPACRHRRRLSLLLRSRRRDGR